nr:deoxyhypusine synthase [Anser cygnoides]
MAAPSLTAAAGKRWRRAAVRRLREQDGGALPYGGGVTKMAAPCRTGGVAKMAAPCRTAPLGDGPGGGGGGGERAAGPMAAAGPAPAEALRAVLKPSGRLPAGSLPSVSWDFWGPAPVSSVPGVFWGFGGAQPCPRGVPQVPAGSRPNPSGSPRSPRCPRGVLWGPRGADPPPTQVDVLVTTAGGVEEDLIKCLAPTYIGDFSLRGRDLRQNGINRIGNLLVPNDNYCKFEDWLMPILEQMVDEQETQGVRWTPSRMIARLGKEIDNPESVCYWAQKNKIPVLSPALTDGSLGDMIFFHSYKRPGLVLDIVEDLRLINTQAIFARKTGMIILGGGLVKHHIANANLMVRGRGALGGSGGALGSPHLSPLLCRQVYADASLVFPLLVAETFAQRADAFPVEPQGD